MKNFENVLTEKTGQAFGFVPTIIGEQISSLDTLREEKLVDKSA